jgi:TonB family protein
MMSTSASGVKKPEHFDLYVGRLRSICEMHGISTGLQDHLSGFLNRLDDDRRFGMDFWALVGKLSSREGGELNDDQTLAVVVAGITGQLPDENDDSLRPQINQLQALLSGVDIQRPEPQLTEPEAPARSTAAVPIDRRRRFSITPEDAPPTLETQMLETIQRLEAINRQLKENLLSIDQRINLLETRLGDYPADILFSGASAPQVTKTPPPPVSRRVVNPPVNSFSVAASPRPVVHPHVAIATPSIKEPIREQIREPIPERIQQPIEQPIRHERYPVEPALRPQEIRPQEQSTPLSALPIAPVEPNPSELHLPQPNPAPAQAPAPVTSSIEESTLHATPATIEEPAILHPAPVNTPETPAAPTTPGRERPQENPVQRSQVPTTKVEKAPIPKTEVPESQIWRTQAAKIQPKPPGTTSKQRLVLDPIAPPAPSRESSSGRKVSKTHTRPLFAGYESSSGSSGKKVAAGLAIALVLAGSGYAWHRYSTLITQLVHPNQSASSTTQTPDATPEDSTSQPAQPQSQAVQSQPDQSQTGQSQPDQTQTGQSSADQPSSTGATPQSETPAEPPPHKPALDRPTTKAAATAEDLFANSNWSAIKVPSEVMQKNLIVSRVPTYPDSAKASRVKGTVIVEALIQKDGSVGRVRVLQGDSRLRSAAMDTIFRQKYRPYMVNGTPVDVITTVSMDFAPPR